MFRITHFMQELRSASAPSATRRPAGPVVIWNLLRRCNLTCKHCYSISADKKFPGELGTEEIRQVMADLKAFGVPAIILSGGEPLLHPDIFDIATHAKQLGFYTGLSSNGTLINTNNISAIAATGFNYVGVSLDGIGPTHDRFRRLDGAFDAAMRGIRLCKARDIKVGLRFTLTQDNAAELPQLLRLLDDEGIDKFYLSHLNYAGRGGKNRRDDVYHKTTREAMDLLFAACWRYLDRHDPKEFVTGNNDADGVYFLRWVEEHYPTEFDRMRAALARWGGNAAGVNVANIDNLGNVHPDTMWWKHTLGNVMERPFSAIWQDVSDPIMAGLKRRPRPVTGRCGTCGFLDVCNGNTRVRAWHMHDDPWAEDPACYLDDDEISSPVNVLRKVENG